jgi:hypothetical protein
MLGAMGSPEDSDNDRRAVPRHLRDGENDLLSSTGAFGQRTEDAASRRGRWALILFALAVVAAAGWFFLR